MSESRLSTPARTVKAVVRKLVYTVLDKPLPPPTTRERELVQELQNTFRGIPVRETAGLSPSEHTWDTHVNRLRELALSDDIREFLRWDVIGYTMFAHNSGWVAKELKYLKSRSDWSSRWRGAITEVHVGHPLPFWRYPRSSGNLIHSAYHIAQFEEKTGTSIGDAETIFEFGGGYGCMCRMVHNMGFRGKYVVFDLPGFSALQQFYLKSIGLRVHSIESFKSTEAGIVCVSDLGSLDSILGENIDTTGATFIATWSLSETPLALRKTLLSRISGFDAFLISSQSQYKEVDNIEFFERWRNSQADIDWRTWRIAHLGKNFYLMGRRRSAVPK